MWIRPVVAELQRQWNAQPFGSWDALDGKIDNYISTDYDNPEKLELEWINPVVAELQRLQIVIRTYGAIDLRTNERTIP